VNRKSATVILFLLLLPVAVLAQSDSIDSSEFPIIPDSALAQALRGIKLTPSDLSFRTDYTDIDSFRLPVVDALLRDPLSMIVFADDLTNKLLGAFSPGHPRLIKLHDYLLNFETEKFIAQNPLTSIDGAIPWIRQEGPTLHAETEPSEIPCFMECVKTGSDLDPSKSIEYRLALLRKSMQDQKQECDWLFGHLLPEELAFLRDTFPALILEDIEDEFKPVDELDSIQKYEDNLSKRFVEIAEKLTEPDSVRIVSDRFKDSLFVRWSYSRWLFRSTERGLRQSVYPLLDHLLQDCDCADADFLYEITSPMGKMAIGGAGRNTYHGKYAFILDIGGDDVYNLEAVDGLQIIYDVSGNDQYNALTDFAIASGFFYPALLYDLEGDDIYNGRNFSLGSGLFSFGMLVDSSGNDIYRGDTHTQGAGTFGLGLLIDKGGTDSYNCALFGQAFGGIKGLGFLCDMNGNDIYFAGGKYKDFLRYDDHYLSLSQGFAYGLRPWMSGGVALLIDSSGHDTYISDIFGQGSSYWYALGMLVDLAGNDKYLSFQYAQGVGTHLTLGVLLDKSGDDYYFSKGVSQGCGHDLSVGILIDYLGNDTYQAYDLSQGAGSANGFGWLVDYLGDDSYQIKGCQNTQGYGNPRRDYGSIGLFMDLMGKDEYIGNGSNNDYWIIDSKWGIGMDIDFWKVDSIGQDK
jgi:hypothetical protein